jgi:hypothetical protein
MICEFAVTVNIIALANNESDETWTEYETARGWAFHARVSEIALLVALLTGEIKTGGAAMVVKRLTTDQDPVPLLAFVALTRQKYTVPLARLETVCDVIAMLLRLKIRVFANEESVETCNEYELLPGTESHMNVTVWETVLIGVMGVGAELVVEK